MEISPIESLALAIILSHKKVPGSLPFTRLWIFYVAAILLSVCFSSVPMAALFSAWQEARMLLVFTATAMVATDERGPKAIVSGMGLALAVNAGYAIQQRFSGMLQPIGLFSHQNLGGMASHFVALPALAMVLADKKFRTGFLAIAAAAVIVILGASRGTIGFAALGYGLVLALSLIRKPTARKFSLVAMAVLALAAATPFAMGALDRRFTAAPINEVEYNERSAFEKAAKLMWQDHPMGIGANQYVGIANMGGYSERAGVIWNSGSRSAHVHNLYLLLGAETGYIGLLAMLALIFTPIIIGIKTAWRRGQDQIREVLIGPSMALAIVALHSMYEWVFVTYTLQWLFAINLGLISGIVYRLKRDEARQRRNSKQSRSPDGSLPVTEGI